MQALQLSEPAFPTIPGMPGIAPKTTFGTGTTTLFAATTVADGTVITSLHRKHRAVEFKKFLTRIDHEVPEQLEIHLICDNYGTHKHPIIKAWLEVHPRAHLHLTPTNSSLAEPDGAVLRLRHRRPAPALRPPERAGLAADIRRWVKAWNEDLKPFVWSKTAEQILGSLGRLIQGISNAGN